MSAREPDRIETSLGPELVFTGECWQLDLAELPVVHGLSVLSRALAEMVLGQARSDRVDVAVERRLRPRENPELVERFGIDQIKVTAELATIEQAADLVEVRLRALLGSLQRQRYQQALFADPPRALVAEFDGGAQRYVLEHLPSRRDAGRGALRVTIDGERRCLDLSALPHVLLENAADRHFIAGSTRIAQTWTESLRRECARGRRSFFEQRDPHSHLFKQLDQAGLGSLQKVSIQWAESALPLLLENEPAVASELLKRVLLALEDRTVRRLLGERQAVRIGAGAVPVWLQVAQLGRVLELSVGQQPARGDTDAFLQRMPVLQRLVQQHGKAQPLSQVSVFLVHHMTAEVVGLIAALRALGCRDLVCLFVTYAGEPPASYLDAVLDLPTDEFSALALANVPHRGSVEGVYRLSEHYSQLAERDAILRALAGRDTQYLTAMRAVAVVPFLRQLARAEQAGRRCLLIEDGGYLAPPLHEALLTGKTVGEFAAALGHACTDARPAAALGAQLFGTVEHTRNGYDRLVELLQRHGRLPLPAYSIAVSKLKREVESREIAASVLNAVETVLNADGRILARRRCLVLGSRGAIGRELCRTLHGRLDDAERSLRGLDRVATGAPFVQGLQEWRAAGELGEHWLDVDLVVGATGDSVLQGADIERWLLQSRHEVLTLASASTKKVEFRALMHWFQSLLQNNAPAIGGTAVTVGVVELLDPRTQRLYAHRWCFQFASGRKKSVVALAHLTPVNFLFYGAATELIDEVLAQLLSLSLGAVRRGVSGDAVPGLCAVDREVDAEARLLTEPQPQVR